MYSGGPLDLSSNEDKFILHGDQLASFELNLAWKRQISLNNLKCNIICCLLLLISELLPLYYPWVAEPAEPINNDMYYFTSESYNAKKPNKQAYV